MNSTVARMDTQRKVLEAMNLTPEQEMYYIKRAADPASPYPAGLYFGTQQKAMIHASFSDPSYDPTIRDWYKSGLNNAQFKFGGAYVDMDSGNVVVTASATLHDAAGGIRGVAAGDVQLNEVSQIVSSTRLKQSGGAFLVDASTNTVLGSGDSTATGKTLGDLGSDTVFGRTAQWIDGGSEGLHQAKVGGKNYWFFVEWVSNADWAAVCFVPETEILSAVNSMTTTLIIVAAVAVVVLSALIFILINGIVIVPVKKLDAAAQRIADVVQNNSATSEETAASSEELSAQAQMLNDLVEKFTLKT